MNRPAFSRNLPDLQALEDFAEHFAAGLRAPMVVYLQGPLGAGKTAFTRAVVTALGHEGKVKSPTYGLLESYDFKDFRLLHLDLYRVENPEEIEYLALRDLLGDDAVLLIEWPGRGGDAIPPPDIEVVFSESVSERALSATAHSAPGEKLLFTISFS